MASRTLRTLDKKLFFDVERFYPRTQRIWLARLDHSHCNSADPLTDGLEVCCVFYRPGPGGCYVCCVVVEGFGEQGEGGDAPQGSRRPRGGCHRGLGHMHCDSAGPWQASASCRLRKGCPGAMSSTRTIQSWRGAPRGHAVRVGCASVRPPLAMPRPPFLLFIFPYSGYTFKHLRARPCPQYV